MIHFVLRPQNNSLILSFFIPRLFADRVLRDGCDARPDLVLQLDYGHRKSCSDTLD